MTCTDQAAVKLLLVDDLEENLLALEALLARRDLELLKARCGTEALELLLIHDVALALIDVQMPELDGFELAELMRGRERTRGVPIIFVTAGPRESNRVFKGYDAGAVDFLFKPIDEHILRHKVDTFVELYRQRQQLAAHMERIRESESELRRVNEQLAATLRLNEMFVAAVGHDLRTPLNNVVMSAELLLQHASGGTDQRVLERLRANARRMSSMIDELFDLARARLSGGIAIAPQDSVDLLALAEKTAAELSAGQPKQRFELTHRGDMRGRWDPERITQVLSNLLGNALRHGDPQVQVQLDLDGTDPRALAFSVANRGEIAPEVLSCLFEPFRRGRERASKSEGLGLGLFIVHQIVLAHGGRIAAESQDGVTTFRVELPRRAESLAPQQQSA